MGRWVNIQFIYFILFFLFYIIIIFSDLGSNEIKISEDKTVAIVDGSGVLFDPNGLDREEITRLANNRQMVEHINKDKISPTGSLVLLSDVNKTLPSGDNVESGLAFRNNFHVSKHAHADFFVPCGGRPASVHVNNVHKLLSSDGKPVFKYVVEGANLFFTQDARLALESAGCVLFKD